MSTRPLDGIRIVSLAEQYPGPFATLLLGDLGADVVQIERPSGDPSRAYPGFYEALNRGKRSVVIDLKEAADARSCRELVDAADVLLEGFRPGVMDRLGLGYAAVRASNPRLIYVSISGFGQDGPYRDRPAHDLSFQAMAGLLDDGVAEPAVPGLSLADLSAGVFAAVAALTGLSARATSNTGGYYDVAMFDSLLSFMTSRLVPIVNTWPADTLGLDPGYGLFATSDGRWVSLSIAFEDHFWNALCHRLELLDVADLNSDERTTRRAELHELVAQQISGRTADEWESRLGAADVPFGVVRALDELAAAPHVAARNLLQPVQRAGEDYLALRQPLVVNGEPFGPRGGAPLLGQHTDAVLEEWAEPAHLTP
jgi:crotonobetainyl-CoA:carnitine CoA-transferase CaiB-like acyl-CoA transferase